MVVDITVKRAPSYTVASMRRVGPYRRDMLRAEFNQLVKWAEKRKIRTGKWILYFLDEPGGRRPENKLRSEACLEIKGKAKADFLLVSLDLDYRFIQALQMLAK